MSSITMPVDRMIQAAIALVSNKRADVDVSDKDFKLYGIFKYEGGVVVDHRDIVIKRSFGEVDCYDDTTKDRNSITQTVTKVTNEILALETTKQLYQYAINNSGLPKKRVYELINDFVISEVNKGNPLNNLFLH